MKTESAIQNESLPESSRSANRALLLRPIDCPDFDSIVTIQDKESTLGSSEECDVPLPYSEIAAHHLTIIDCGDEWTLKANDKNTWINGKSVQISDLRNGDRLKIGTLEFEVELISRSAEERPGSRNTKKKTDNKIRVKRNNRKKKSGFSKSETRQRSKKKVNDNSVNRTVTAELSAIDNLPHDDVAECLTIMKSLQKELEKETAEMKLFKQNLDQERERIRQERQQLQDGFAALTQAREAMKVRESLLDDRERNPANPNSNQSDLSIHSLYRKSKEEKISDLRSELADKFDIELNDDRSACKQKNASESLPDFDEQELAELESAISLDHRAEIEQETEQTANTDTCENGDLSMQVYMQNLLERSRQGLPEDDARKDQSLDRGLAPRKKSANQDSNGVSNPESLDLEESENPPTHQIDKQSVRADLQSMRELANISARTAIARHSTKQSKNSIFLKLALSILSFSLAVAIYHLTHEGFQIAAVLQAGAVSIGAITLAELLRSLSRTSKTIFYDSDDRSDDIDETQNVEFEINDSAILNNSDLISEAYQTDFSHSENELDTPGEESNRRDELEPSEEEQKVLESESHTQNDAVSSKDTIMEIPVEPEFEE